MGRTKFPLKEAEIIELIYHIIRGLEDNPDVFPNPPIAPAELKKKIDRVVELQEKSIAAHAEAAKATEEKDKALNDVVYDGKTEISFAERAVDYDNAELKKIGWSGRKTPKAKGMPGACSNVRAIRQGPGGTAEIACDEPTKGGKPDFFVAEKRILPDGQWEFAKNTYSTTTVIKHLPRGKSVEFRMYAVNGAGQGPPTNTLTLVF